MDTVGDVDREHEPTLLVLASFEKGHEVLRAAKADGCRVLLITDRKLASAAWPRESIDEVFYMPDMYNREHLTNAVSYLARTEHISRIVPLDEYDMEMAATLREHMRLPGMGETAMRFFRDKLAMRKRAAELGITVPEFSAVLNHDDLNRFMERVSPPWFLKPRTFASAIGIKRVTEPSELWQLLHELGDRQSHHLLEQYIGGDVYHVDSIVSNGTQVFADVHRYARPPFDVYHGGGIFCTRTLPRDGGEARELRELTERIINGFGLSAGAVHTEFIRSRADGRFYFLETAARVGGAHISDLVEAATGVNLWREWARVEAAAARGTAYHLPEVRGDYAGVILSLARQEWPDTSGYTDPEIVLRPRRSHHAGLVVASPDPGRVEELLLQYLERFREDFYAAMPAAENPTS
jgi:biotin carboxylase